MPAANIDVLRQVYAAWNRGDLEGMLEHFDPGMVFVVSGVFPDLQPEYRGHAGFRDFWGAFTGDWENLSVNLEDILEHDGRLLALFTFHGRGRDGIAVDRFFAHLVTMRAGKVTRVRGYAEREQALRALEQGEGEAATA